MFKLVIGITLALFLSTGDLKSENHTLPKIDQGYQFINLPVICAPEQLVFSDLTAMGYVAVNMSLGRQDSDPRGEAVYLLTYWLNEDATSTAATMNLPNNDETCVIFVTHDLVIKSIE